MTRVGIRELKQNASAVVAEAAAGELVTITDRGRPVAQLGPIGRTRVAAMVESGLARAPRRSLRDLPPPKAAGRRPDPLSAAVADGRSAERY